VCHVCLDKVTSSKGCAERQFTGEDTSSNDTCELAGVVTGACRVSTADTEQVEHGRLRLEDCTTANGTDFDTRHGDRDLKVTTKTDNMLAYDLTDESDLTTYFFMTVIQLLLSTF
jgi:hypothetical protein